MTFPADDNVKFAPIIFNPCIEILETVKLNGVMSKNDFNNGLLPSVGFIVVISLFLFRIAESMFVSFPFEGLKTFKIYSLDIYNIIYSRYKQKDAKD